MSNRFNVIVSVAFCICSMSVYSDAALTKKSQPSTEVSTQNKSVLSKDLLTLEKAEVAIKKMFANCTIKSGVLQEGNRAYVWVNNMGGLGPVTLLIEFHHYNDGRWMLHSVTRQRTEVEVTLKFEPVE